MSCRSDQLPVAGEGRRVRQRARTRGRRAQSRLQCVATRGLCADLQASGMCALQCFVKADACVRVLVCAYEVSSSSTHMHQLSHDHYQWMRACLCASPPRLFMSIFFSFLTSHQMADGTWGSRADKRCEVSPRQRFSFFPSLYVF